MKKESKRTGLHLEATQVDDILNSLDGGQSTRPAKSGRGVRANRRIYDLKIGLSQPGGTRTEFVVVTRNFASNGISFLHRNYVHVGSKFDADIPTLDGGAVIHIKGVVVRCRHVVNMIHEVGIRFEEAIDLPNFAALTPEDEQQCWTEIERRRKSSDHPQELGKALVVDDVKSQRAIAQVWLERMGFQVLEAATGTEALTAIKEQQIDIVLLDMMLGQESGLDTCRALREAKFYGMIIAVTGDTDDSIRRKALTTGCDTFVSKPITARNLHQAIDIATGDKGSILQKPVQSSLDQDEKVRPLILDFVDTLPASIDRLAGAITTNEVATIREVCKLLKADGGALGFWQITQAADAAVTAFAMGAKLDEAQKQVGQLLQILRRVAVSEFNPPQEETPASADPTKV
jgi:CheY-like chemotaxis protein